LQLTAEIYHQFYESNVTQTKKTTLYKATEAGNFLFMLSCFFFARSVSFSLFLMHKNSKHTYDTNMITK